jgi:uncharacterized protein (DUF305 family)
MNSRTLEATRSLLLAPLAALCLATTAQAQTAQPMASSASMPMGQMQKNAGGPDAMKQSMMGGMDAMQKLPMSGDTDKDFAMMMKIHHQGALDMAQVELDQGKSPEMKAMAKSIIAAQKKEIAQFDRWLAKHK